MLLMNSHARVVIPLGQVLPQDALDDYLLLVNISTILDMTIKITTSSFNSEQDLKQLFIDLLNFN